MRELRGIGREGERKRGREEERERGREGERKRGREEERERGSITRVSLEDEHLKRFLPLPS